MLKIEGLYKKYKGKDRYAVEDLSMQINDGEIFGFLGTNGAGKSTTIKCVTGILPFEQGKITINGHDIVIDSENAKACMGYVSDDHAVYENLTGKEYVNFVGNIYGVPADIIETKMNDYAKRFGMTRVINSQIRSYSYGLKQKISIIAALVHDPDVWILDEPLTGLDPQSTYEIKECMKRWKQKNKIVFFSSHNIDMVEKLCDRVAIISDSKLLEVFDVKEFIESSELTLEQHFLNVISGASDKYQHIPEKETEKISEKITENTNETKQKELKEKKTKKEEKMPITENKQGEEKMPNEKKSASKKENQTKKAKEKKYSKK